MPSTAATSGPGAHGSRPRRRAKASGPATSSTSSAAAPGRSGSRRPSTRPVISTRTPPSPKSTIGPRSVWLSSPTNASPCAATIVCTATVSGASWARAMARSSRTTAAHFGPRDAHADRVELRAVRNVGELHHDMRAERIDAVVVVVARRARRTARSEPRRRRAARIASVNGTIAPTGESTSGGGGDGAGATDGADPDAAAGARANRSSASSARYVDRRPRQNTTLRSW